LRIRLVLALLLVAAASGDAFACDSTGCLLVTRSAGGLLPRRTFRLDLSFRATDDSQLMSGSWDLLLNAQASRRLSNGGLDLTGAFSYQANTTNDLGYSYGDDAIGSLALARPLASRLRAWLQLKWAHRGRSDYHGEGVESTGGTIVYAIRYVNETQVAPRLSVVAGIARSF
jgi:hypothetical protein